MTSTFDKRPVLEANRPATIDNLTTRLLSLPAELRCKIWEYAIGNQNIHFAIARTELTRTLSPLLPRAYPCVLSESEVELGEEARNSEATWYPQSCEHRHAECLKHFKSLHDYKYDAGMQTWHVAPERTLDDCFWKRQVSLLLVCSQMHDEMLPILYSTTNWIVSIHWLKDFWRHQVQSDGAMPHLKLLRRLELHFVNGRSAFKNFKHDLSPLSQLQQLVIVVDIWEPPKLSSRLRLQMRPLSLPPRTLDWVEGFQQVLTHCSTIKSVKVFPYIATPARGWIAPFHPVHSGRELYELMSVPVEQRLQGR